MNLKQVIALSLLSCSFAVNADTLSISAGGGSWSESSDGYIRDTGDPEDIDVTDQLFWDDESQGYYFVTLEHFVPILPNIRLMYTSLDQSGSGEADFEFDDVDFAGQNISNDFSIETTDIIAYYEVLDNVVSLDLGLNIRFLDIDYTVKSTDDPAISTSDSFSEVVPMLYAMVGVSPWPDLIISGEMSYMGYSGSSYSDFTAKVAYTTEYFVGIEAGYRTQSIELDDIDDTVANLDFDGMFVGAYVKF
jgi:outer membrane protein